MYLSVYSSTRCEEIDAHHISLLLRPSGKSKIILALNYYNFTQPRFFKNPLLFSLCITKSPASFPNLNM